MNQSRRGVSDVEKLRLLPAPQTADAHDGEVFGCVFAPDGETAVSAGWDGHLRLWDVTSGEPTSSVRVAAKPLSCCGFTPDSTQLIAGSMEGLLSFWNRPELTKAKQFLAHTRPI